MRNSPHQRDRGDRRCPGVEEQSGPSLISSSEGALAPGSRSGQLLMIIAMDSPSTSGYRPSMVDGSDRSESPTTQDWLLIWLEMLLAIGAVVGAVGIVWGDILGDAVDRLPFGSATFAGLALFTINGLYPLTVVIGSLLHQQWVRWGHIVVGFALMGWIAVQIAYLGPPVHWLQILYFAWGLTIAAIAWWLMRCENRNNTDRRSRNTNPSGRSS